MFSADRKCILRHSYVCIPETLTPPPNLVSLRMFRCISHLEPYSTVAYVGPGFAFFTLTNKTIECETAPGFT